MSSQAIEIHYAKMEEWLTDRRSVLSKKTSLQDLDRCAALARKLVQNVKYDIPALKKQLNRLEKQRDEAQQAVSSAPKAQSQAVEKRNQFLLRYSIPLVGPESGEGIEDTIDAALESRIQLAESRVSELICAASVQESLNDALRTYDDVVSPASSGEAASMKHFPWLYRLATEDLAKLNRACQENHQAHDGNAGCTVNEETDEMGSIDWGDDDGAVVSSVAPDSVEICWDDEGAAEEIQTVVETAPALSGASDITSMPQPPPRQTGGSGPSIHIVSRAEHRAAVLSELLSLTAFIDERILDHLISSDVAVTPQNRNAHCPQLVALLNAMESMRATLCDGVDAELIRMRQNFRLKEKFITSFEGLMRGISVVAIRCRDAEGRAAAALEEMNSIEPQLNKLVQDTKSDHFVAKDMIQRMFPDREVLITGDVNSL